MSDIDMIVVLEYILATQLELRKEDGRDRQKGVIEMWKFTVKPQYSGEGSMLVSAQRSVFREDVVAAVQALTFVWEGLTEPLRRLIRHVNIVWGDRKIGDNWQPCPGFEFILDEGIFGKAPIHTAEWRRRLTGEGPAHPVQFASDATNELLKQLRKKLQERGHLDQQLLKEIGSIMGPVPRSLY